MARTIRKRNLTGVPFTEPRPYEARHAEIAREAAEEGIVLLENKGDVLPLKPGSRVALFGAGAVRTIKGGTGSGDVNERDTVSIYRGMTDAGFQITTTEWIRAFEKEYEESRAAWKKEIVADATVRKTRGEFNAFFKAYSARQYAMPSGPAVYKTGTDTAVFVISRVAGENADRRAAEKDYYLSVTEYGMLTDLCALYAKVIVLVNAGGVIDLSFMDELPAIKALLVISQPGMAGGHAVANILKGAVCPSGKLTDSWAVHYQDYPNAATFSHNNGNVEREEYEEGIYVGYRWFDSFEIPVRYGFGCGLSYTRFSLRTNSVTADENGVVSVNVTVENTGEVAGKEVVQIYAALPYGKIEKEARRLVSFGKTPLLHPGQKERMTLCFNAESLESYDEASSVWVLEKGVYGVYVGNSLASARPAAALALPEDKILKRTRCLCAPAQPIAQRSLPAERGKNRYSALLKQAASVPQIAYSLAAVQTQTIDYTLAEPQDEAARIVEGLTQEQLIHLVTGDPGKNQDSVVGGAGTSVPGSAGETSVCALEQGVANIVLADGPAGLRLNQHYRVVDGVGQLLPFIGNIEHGYFSDGTDLDGEQYYQFCTAIPVGTMLAQTWNLPLLEKVGAMVGEEMLEFDVQLWLAPGMNLHRNPLCGRNFEYFAEDPLLSGRCAAAITRGVQSRPGIGTTIKHCACNNQEDNRMASDSVLSERALRELYLKGFEIAIRESQPFALMTSYNFINGVHAANNRDLCTDILRAEFVFQGLIMTDWLTTNVDDICTAPGCIRAGNELIMPGREEDHDALRRALTDGTLPLEQLKRCAAQVVRTVLKTNCYEYGS